MSVFSSEGSSWDVSSHPKSCFITTKKVIKSSKIREKCNLNIFGLNHVNMDPGVGPFFVHDGMLSGNAHSVSIGPQTKSSVGFSTNFSFELILVCLLPSAPVKQSTQLPQRSSCYTLGGLGSSTTGRLWWNAARQYGPPRLQHLFCQLESGECVQSFRGCCTQSLHLGNWMWAIRFLVCEESCLFYGAFEGRWFRLFSPKWAHHRGFVRVFSLSTK